MTIRLQIGRSTAELNRQLFVGLNRHLTSPVDYTLVKVKGKQIRRSFEPVLFTTLTH